MRSGPRFVQLSEQFVDSLRAFFDSLDLERTGFVSYENICQRWRQFPPRLTKLLPPNFLQHLAHTVPPNGFVSFERFLAGVRISVAEQQIEQRHLNQMPSSKRGGEMKRVQSEGGNLHINGLEDDEDDLYGSAGLNDIYGSYGNYIKIQKPVMGVKGSSVTGKPPPPNYGSNNNGGTSSSPAIDFNENKVQLRPKKHGNERNGTYSRSNGPSQFRPVSTNSVSSSSSMAEIRWRDSRLSNTSTPLGDQVSGTPTSNNRHSSYLPEHSSQVAKHERLLDEEFEVIRRGLDISQMLTEWYEKRMASLEKRKEMLNKGMVALDSAVHEQKLNFVRAQVSEVNRRIQSLMQSNEKGFPNHQNMIRNPVLPPSGANGRISNSSTPESFSNNNNNNSPASTTWLHAQNQKLAEELEAKSRLIEQLQREKKLYEIHNASTVGHQQHHQRQHQEHKQQHQQQQHHPTNHHHQAVYMRATPTAYVRPAMQTATIMNGIHLPPSPIKIPDTLL